MKTGSLRFRLIAWYVGVLTLVVAVLAAMLSLHLSRYLKDNLWETQTRRARQIADTLVVNLERTGERTLTDEIERMFAPEKSDRFFRITQDTGRVVYLSGAPNDLLFDPLSVPTAPNNPAPEFTRTERGAGGSGLLISAARVRSDAGANYLVEVGVSAAPVDALFHHLIWLFVIALPVVVVLAAAGGYVLIGHTLEPVDRIGRKAEQISQHNLSERLPVPNTGDEVERLSQSLNRMIGRLDDAFQNSKRFVADASHELRTPLTILRGETEEMVRDGIATPGQREQLGSILEELERLSKIVERLFALSRLDAGEAQAEWVRFDLAELAGATAAQMALLAEDRHIALSTEVPHPVPMEGDRSRLKQVVVNLLDNAIKYTPEGGAVHLKVHAVGSEAVLEVRDTGVGIDPAEAPHVFERFYRADKSRSREPDGAGLGLAIVKSICQANRGEVDVTSVVGEGSTFRVRFPLTPPNLV